MSRALSFAYGVVSYLVFLGSFLYSVGFLANVGVPKGIDSGPTGPLAASLAIDVLLLSLFAIQHSGMARRAFKRWLSRRVSPSVERSTFVLASSLVLFLTFWQWRPIPGVVWHAGEPGLRIALWGAYGLGWGILFASTFMISHAHLFGLRQVWDHLRQRAPFRPPFQTRWLYRYVRHPLMLGFLIAFWATPHMTWGHLLFAAMSTGYIVFATFVFEEPALERALGERYRNYREQVPAFLPRPGRSVPTMGPETRDEEAASA